MNRCRDHSKLRSTQQSFETSPLQRISRAIPQEVRQPGREADNLSNAEVKKA
jgi:hypothetical protein